MLDRLYADCFPVTYSVGEASKFSSSSRIIFIACVETVGMAELDERCCTLVGRSSSSSSVKAKQRRKPSSKIRSFAFPPTHSRDLPGSTMSLLESMECRGVVAIGGMFSLPRLNERRNDVASEKRRSWSEALISDHPKRDALHISVILIE